MRQIRVSLTFVKDAYVTSAESDWIDTTSPDHYEQLIQETSAGAIEMLESEHGYVTFQTNGEPCFYAGKYITAVKIHTREKPNE